ncbi:MAG: MBOAT family protein [Planctomycetes bacterium]|nr:MBOAT family protein [Planctomycetota bacterium]
MLFNSLAFLVFLPATYLVYVLLRRRRYQNPFLLAASYLFYGWWDWRFLSLLLFSTVVDYAVARAIDRSDTDAGRRRYLLVSVFVNLGLLGFFKYFNFFVGSAQALLAGLGVDAAPFRLGVALPVGISFYTFQELSYTIDVYRRERPAAKSLLDFALFVSFWPQLVAGPIERSGALLPQIEGEREVTLDGLYAGFKLIAWGMFKKVAIADTLAETVTGVFGAPPPHAGGMTLLALYAFAFQIYCDFSGYSDIARGCARAMGFELMVNFRRPYFATDIQAFWRRWHISLSTWLRDYLYVPLGGNRSGATLTYRNLFLTMLLGGLWHGASWTFVLWGGYHGALLGLTRAWHERREAAAARRAADAPPPLDGWPSRVARVLVCFHLVCLGWLFFRAGTLSQAWEMLGGLCSPSLVTTLPFGHLSRLLFIVSPLLLVETLQARNADDDLRPHVHWVARGLAYTALFYYLLLRGRFDGYDFIYFQF